MADPQDRNNSSFLVEIVRHAHQNASPAVSVAEGTVDWRNLYRLAEAHGLLSWLGVQLRPGGYAGMPEWFADRLVQQTRANALRNRMLLEEFHVLTEAFASRGIATVALKGIAFIQGMYDDPAMRELADIDLLIDIGHRPVARALLEERGYHAVYTENMLPPGQSRLDSAQERVFEGFYHAYSYESADGLINVDLHWRLAPAVYPTAVDAAFATQAAVRNPQEAAATLPTPLQLLCQCMHGAKDGWSELKWALDVDAIASRMDRDDWPRAWALASQLRARRMLLTGLALSTWLTGRSFPEAAEWQRSPFQPSGRLLQRLQERLLDDPDRRFRRVPCLALNKTYMSLCDRRRDAAIHTWRMLSRAEPRDFARFGLRSALLPIWPVLRPFLLSADCLRRALRRVMAPAIRERA